MSELEFYGTMPAVLPETLPPGTRCAYKDKECGSATEVKLEKRPGNEYPVYWGLWGLPWEQWTDPKNIDWSRVRRKGSELVISIDLSEQVTHEAVIRMRTEGKPNEEIAEALGLEITKVMMLSVTPLPTNESAT
jgi:hypothetical protein